MHVDIMVWLSFSRSPAASVLFLRLRACSSSDDTGRCCQGRRRWQSRTFSVDCPPEETTLVKRSIQGRAWTGSEASLQDICVTGPCWEDDGLLARREAEKTKGHVLDLRWTVARKPTQEFAAHATVHVLEDWCWSSCLWIFQLVMKLIWRRASVEAQCLLLTTDYSNPLIWDHECLSVMLIGSTMAVIAQRNAAGKD